MFYSSRDRTRESRRSSGDKHREGGARRQGVKQEPGYQRGNNGSNKATHSRRDNGSPTSPHARCTRKRPTHDESENDHEVQRKRHRKKASENEARQLLAPEVISTLIRASLGSLLADRLPRNTRSTRLERAPVEYSSCEENSDSEECDDDTSDSEYDDDEEEDHSEEALERRYRRKLKREQCTKYDDYREKLKKISGSAIPLRYRVLDAAMPDQVKALCMQHIDQLGDDDDSGTTKRRGWLNTLLQVPFGVYTRPNIDPLISPVRRMTTARSCLDSVIFGNEVAKDTLMQLVAQGLSNPGGSPPIIGLVGPPGVGKTTLARHGIAAALGKPFRQISCGGMHDAAALRGHSYTWEGSSHGALLGCMMQTGCMDPVILLDEVDKIGDTKHGEEVQSLLIHLLDPTQNSTFQDEYLTGIELDFSRAVFVLSLNDMDRLSPILRDRVHFVQMQTPTNPDKVSICRQFIVDRCVKNVGLDPETIQFPDTTLNHAVTTGPPEQGVRNLSRNVEGCIRKLNLLRVLGADRLRETLPKVNDADVERTKHAITAAVTVISPSLYDILKPEAPQVNSAPQYMYM